MKKWFVLLMLVLPFACSYAQVDQSPLPADQAFSLSAQSVSTKGINLVWQIAPGYHLYREKLSFVLATPKTAHLGKIDLPPGTPEENPILGKFQQYQNSLSIQIPINAPNQSHVTLIVGYQGCQDKGICYPPVTKKLSFVLANHAIAKIETPKEQTTIS